MTSRGPATSTTPGATTKSTSFFSRSHTILRIPLVPRCSVAVTATVSAPEASIASITPYSSPSTGISYPSNGTASRAGPYPGRHMPTTRYPAPGERSNCFAIETAALRLPTIKTEVWYLPLLRFTATPLRHNQRLRRSPKRPTGRAIAKYKRAMSTLKSRDTIAITPKSLKVADTMRRYSSAPLPMTRVDRVRKMARNATHNPAKTTDTPV